MTEGDWRISRRLYRTDISGRKLDDLTDLIHEGSVTMNQDATTALSFQASVREEANLVPWRDFLLPEVEIVRSDGSRVGGQVGLFVVPTFPSRHNWSHSSRDIDGRDLTWLLENDAYEDTVTLAPGADPYLFISDVITSTGIPAEKIRITRRRFDDSDQADLPEVLLTGRDWINNESKLEIVNDVLSALSSYALHPDLAGNLVSFPTRDLASATANVTYTSGTGSTIVGDIEDDPSDTTFANVIIVTAGSPVAQDAPPPTPDPGDPTPGPIAQGETVKVTERLNLRIAGGLSNRVITVLPVGTAAKVIGDSVTADGYTWWPLDATIAGVGQRQGWSAQDWLEVVPGAPDPVTQPEEIPPSIIRSVRINDIPGPTSILPWPNGIGRRVVRREAPSDIETQAQADALADRLLQESLSHYRKLTLRTLPDPLRAMHEVYELNILNRRGDIVADGKWLCRGWELPFGPGEMTHTCHREQGWSWKGANG